MMERRAALVSKHFKHPVIAPVFEEYGWTLEELIADTDELGTFSGEVPRRYPPDETVRRKALMGRERSDAPWLVASEGTIFSSLVGLVDDHEIVALVARHTSRVILGRASDVIPATSFGVTNATSSNELLEHCASADLPRHHLLVAPANHEAPSIGALATLAEVRAACDYLLRYSSSLLVQTDMRAHLCPSRRDIIARAARDLMIRCAQPCPRCGEFGFGDDGPVPGLECGACARATDEPRAQRWRCPSCALVELRTNQGVADPARCAWCNP